MGRPCEYADGKLRKCKRTKDLKSKDCERSSTNYSFEMIKCAIEPKKYFLKNMYRAYIKLSLALKI